MKSIGITLVLVVLAGHGSAQAVAPEGQPNDFGPQRALISAERARFEAGFLAENAACYKKFAVNNCLNDVNSRRRQSMADLRRREILLNDEERKIKGAEQIRRTAEKSSPEKQRESSDRVIKADEDYQARQQREKSKSQERATAQSNEKTARDANADRLLRNQEKAMERSRKQTASAAEAKKYADRQNEAQQRRAEHEAENKNQAKPTAKSLPVPAL